MNEQNIPQANEPAQSSRNIWITIVTIIITAIVVGAGVYACQRSNLQSKEQSLQQQITALQNQIESLQQEIQPVATTSEVTQKLTQPVGKIAKWKFYQSKEFGFELKMPSYVSIDKIFNDQYNRLVIFKSEKENFEVRLTEGKNIALDQYYYLDFPVSSRSIFGGKEALVFEAPNGYCDGPNCSDPFIAYSTKYGDDFYNLVFSGDVKLNDIEKSILESFRFTK